MPRTRFASPFAYQTPIGASLNNISSLLFAGPGPIEQDKMQAEAELRRAQVQKELNAADIARRVYERQADPTFHAESASLLSGVPLPNILADTAYLRGNGGPMPPAVPAGTDINRAREALAAIRLGMADNRSTAGDVAGATGKFQRQRFIGDAASGVRSPTEIAAALYADTGHAPFHTTEGGSGNVLTGETSLNDLGMARTEERRAAAGNQRAQAGQHAADTRQIDMVNRAGVGGRFGVPVIVNDAEAGLTYTSPSAAIGRTPGARPVDRAITLKPVLNADGTTTWQSVADAEGAQVGAPPRAPARTVPPRPLSGKELEAVDAAIANAVGESNTRKVDGATMLALKARIGELMLDPTSEFYRNPYGAAEAAVGEVGGLKDDAIFGNRYVARNPRPARAPAIPTVAPSGPGAAAVPQVPPRIAARLPVAAAPALPPVAGGGGLPPAAAARLREGVVTKFANGTAWTLQGGKPVQIQ